MKRVTRHKIKYLIISKYRSVPGFVKMERLALYRSVKTGKTLTQVVL